MSSSFLQTFSRATLLKGCSACLRDVPRSRYIGSWSMTGGKSILYPVSVSVSQNRHYMKKKTIKIPPTKHLSFDWAGDIEKSLPKLDESKPRLEFEDSTLLPDADERVKKVLSLEFGTSQDKKKLIMDRVQKAVLDHPADVAALELKIAKQTILIRNEIPHVLKYRKDKRSKTQLYVNIHSRRYNLIRLRDLDKEKFDWLLRELKIKYKQPVDDDVGKFKTKYVPVTKANLRKNKAIEAMEAVKNKQLEKMRRDFEAEMAEFQAMKAKELAQYDAELREMGVNTDVNNMEELFKEMGLKEPYVKPDFVPSRRMQKLALKFKKYTALLQKDKAPI